MEKQGIKDTDIIFLTPTVGSIWLFYQQYLIKKFFPNSKRILINDNHRWDFNLGRECVWYDFIKKAQEVSSGEKYFVHIDEDCFLTNKEGVLDTLYKLENENAALIGPTDNMYPIRGGNPFALNSFFMAGKIPDLIDVWQSFEIQLRFNDLNLPTPNIPPEKIEDEPYYNFFWNYLAQGKRISTVPTGYANKYNSTTLLANNTTFAHHMWYTRKWYTKQIFVDLPHRIRYLRIKKDLDHLFGIKFQHLLLSIDYLQYIPIFLSGMITKNIRRIWKRLCNMLLR